jgi:chromosome segregation ATPase
VNAVKELGKKLAFPLWKRLRWRIEDVTEQRFGPRIDELRRELEGVRGELHAVRDELRQGTAGRDREFEGRLHWHEDELRRLAVHVSAIEGRIGSLERPDPVGGRVTEVEEVRAEHARIRARVSAVAQYEERLARVEEALAQRIDAD